MIVLEKNRKYLKRMTNGIIRKKRSFYSAYSYVIESEED